MSITSCCPSRGVCRVLYALYSTEYKEFTGLTCFSDLIDRDIERAVAVMQSVIELGRYIRDIKVIPVKVSDWLCH